mgnify:CR=1 FL=1
MKKFIGDKAFYKMVLLVAVPIMVQNGITNFVNLLDNIMVGQKAVSHQWIPESAATVVSFCFKTRDIGRSSSSDTAWNSSAERSAGLKMRSEQ